MRDLDEEDYRTIGLLASRARDKWERGYYPQDIRVQHEIGWWIMLETQRYIKERLGGDNSE
jgi:hypothetical protein